MRWPASWKGRMPGAESLGRNPRVGPGPGEAQPGRERRGGSGGCRVLSATAPAPGAIGIQQLTGDVEPVLAALTGVAGWPAGRARLVRFADIDRGIAMRLGEQTAQLMPHGGPRVAQRLLSWLLDHGVELVGEGDLDPLALYPEAGDRVEAIALRAIAVASSPLAIELLLDQPRRWRKVVTPGPEDLERSRRLDRLILPPLVVVAGAPNVGKSTLSNALLGRTLSIAADIPGTTRDYTCGRVDLGGLVVDWHDLPGLRRSRDPIEMEAIEIAATLLDRADLVISMRDPDTDWPALPREPNLRVFNKIDLERAGWGAASPGVVRISAVTGQGLSVLVEAVRDQLVPRRDLEHPGPWLFDEALLEGPPAQRASRQAGAARR
jgi:tRNA modification GTPase